MGKWVLTKDLIETYCIAWYLNGTSLEVLDSFCALHQIKQLDNVNL